MNTERREKKKTLCSISINVNQPASPTFIPLQSLNYDPGDHVGVCPMNRAELVNGILEKLTGITNPDEDLQLQLLNEKHTSNGKQRM